MNFTKGLMVGTLISAGVAIYCNEMSKSTKKRMLRQGKKWIKNII